jgi:hypothetical protein
VLSKASYEQTFNKVAGLVLQPALADRASSGEVDGNESFGTQDRTRALLGVVEDQSVIQCIVALRGKAHALRIISRFQCRTLAEGYTVAARGDAPQSVLLLVKGAMALSALDALCARLCRSRAGPPLPVSAPSPQAAQAQGASVVLWTRARANLDGSRSRRRASGTTRAPLSGWTHSV